MEMVSTAKSKKLVERLNAAKPYKDKLLKMMATLGKESESISSPYLPHSKRLSKHALLVLSANRGLCGAYNTNILRLAHQRYEELSSQNLNCDVYMMGRKGNSYFKYLNVPVKENYVHIDENFNYAQSEELASAFMKKFKEGLYDKIEVLSTIYHSAGSQKAASINFLPLSLEPVANDKTNTEEKEEEHSGKKQEQNHIFEPDAKSILEAMIPLTIKTHFYGILLEAMCSEQIARRVAMKNATDAAGDMLNSLLRSYNRARQASITQELAEIVAGADAI